MRTLFCLLLLSATGSVLSEETAKSPHLLIEAANLQAVLAGESGDLRRPITLLDVRAQPAYAEGHIPGATHVDAGQWKAAFGDGTDALAWSERIASVLTDEKSTVVVYDESFSSSAARIWWILKYWGVEDVRVLNGGTQAWQTAGGELERTSEQQPKEESSVAFNATPHPERLATIDEVRAIIGEGSGGTCLVDVRTDAENAAGEIPSARHLDWQDLVDPDTGKLHSPDILKQLLDRIGYDPTTPTVTYCQSGGRASVMAFAMELVSGEPVANYYGSWGEWSKKNKVNGQRQEGR